MFFHFIGSTSCDQSVRTKLLSASSRWLKWDDIQIRHTPSGYSIHNTTSPPYFQLILSHRLSILQAFYGPTSLANDKTLRAQLMRNSSLWIIRITGQISPCPGIFLLCMYNRLLIISSPITELPFYLFPVYAPHIHNIQCITYIVETIKTSYQRINWGSQCSLISRLPTGPINNLLLCVRESLLSSSQRESPRGKKIQFLFNQRDIMFPGFSHPSVRPSHIMRYHFECSAQQALGLFKKVSYICIPMPT